MFYLEGFDMLSRSDEEDFLSHDPRSKQTCYTTKYPFNIFRYRELPPFDFEPVTIFYGGNGSGKSTILNVIAEKLHIRRGAVYNRSDFFDDYVSRCRFYTARGKDVPPNSRIITSDDVFDFLLDLRCINNGVDTQRAKMLEEYSRNRYERHRLNSLDEYEDWRRKTEPQAKTKSRFLRDNLMSNVKERSNGESALYYFTDAIKADALYLLDEPENSLCAARQLDLKKFIEDSVRFYKCQFIISTHSPFLLSMDGAKIYDLDSAPPAEKKWTELENVRTYYDFFVDHKNEFE